MSCDWPVHELSEFINIKHGFAYKGEFFKDTETNDCLLTPGNFAIGGGFQSEKFKYYDGPTPDDYVLRGGELIVTMTDLSKQGDTLGYSALVPIIEGKRLLHNQRIGLVEFLTEEIDKHFLYFLLRSRNYRHLVLSTATGSTVKHTSPTRICQFKFRKPPLDVQQEIGRQLLAIEKKISVNYQINQTLEAMAQAIFKSWFVDFEPVKAKIAAIEASEDAEGVNRTAMSAISGKTDEELDQLQAEQPEHYTQLKNTAELFPTAMQDSELGEVPKGWDVKTIDNVAKKVAMGPFGSNIKVSTFVEKGVPIISGQHLHETLLNESTYNYITEEHAKKMANSCVSSGDLVFTHAGNIGQVSLIPSTTKYAKYVISQRQFYLRPDIEQITSSYLVYFFRSHAGQNLLLANASQVGVPSISRPSSYLKSIEIVVPAKPVQDQFEKIAEGLIEQIVLNREEIESLTRIRDILLPKLLSGELEINAVNKAES